MVRRPSNEVIFAETSQALQRYSKIRTAACFPVRNARGRCADLLPSLNYFALEASLAALRPVADKAAAANHYYTYSRAVKTA